MSQESFSRFATNTIHVGQDPDQWNSHAVIPLISLSTTFKQEAPGEHTGFEYSRSGNPTRNCLEKCLASLENAKHALTFSSGLAATNTITQMLKSGDHVLTGDDLYGGTNRLFRQILSKFSISTTFHDMAANTDFTDLVKENTKLVWLEAPTNPMLKISDITEISRIVHKINKDIIVVVDNTFATPYFQQPLDLGADLVIHSVTKYLNGHGDVVMGAVMTNNDSIAERLKFLQNAAGAVPSAFDCYLVNRGLKTLHLRMQRHMENALEVAKYLEAHPAVERVYYPLLKSHPHHKVAMKQMRGFSGIVSFEIKGDLKSAATFLSSLKTITLAESLGGFESLAEHPAIMTHASVPAEQRKILGISDTLIRISVGLEGVEDILADIKQAIEKSQ